MIKIISHRGNLNGPSPSKENSPSFIDAALKKGFDVEIDMWVVDNSWYLGHDEPEYKISKNFIKDRSEYLWCHAKNIKALKELIDNELHCFYHQSDSVTLTSKGFIWTYPGQQLTSISICLVPEKFSSEVKKYFPDTNYDIEASFGICTDKTF